MITLTQTKATLIDQWHNMLSLGVMPLMEYEIEVNGEQDWIVVDIQLNEQLGLMFSFDDSFPTFFSGDIEQHGNSYLLPFDKYFDSLDHYLEQVNYEMTEGYLIPNGLI